jgi:hypothetical protein
VGIARVLQDVGPQRAFAERLEELTDGVFGPQLAALGLGIEQIESQSVDELEASLERVNDAISHPEAFGSFGVQFTVGASGRVVSVIAGSSTDATITVGVLPLLLRRKKLILERISALRPEEQLASVREAVADRIDDGELKQQVLGLLDERLAAERELTQKLRQEADAVRFTDVERMRFEMEARERRSEIYKSMLERETVAGVIGPVLLFLLAAALTIAMFTHTPISSSVSDSFLLILGYFFGQTTAGRPEGTKKPRTDSV